MAFCSRESKGHHFMVRKCQGYAVKMPSFIITILLPTWHCIAPPLVQLVAHPNLIPSPAPVLTLFPWAVALVPASEVSEVAQQREYFLHQINQLCFPLCILIVIFWIIKFRHNLLDIGKLCWISFILLLWQFSFIRLQPWRILPLTEEGIQSLLVPVNLSWVHIKYPYS